MAISALVKGVVGDGENKKQSGANMAQKMLPGGYSQPDFKPGQGGTDSGERHLRSIKKFTGADQSRSSAIVKPAATSTKKENIANTGIGPLDAAFSSLGGAINSLRGVIGQKFKFEKKDNQQKARRRENLARFLKNKGLAAIGAGMAVAKAIDEKLGFFEKMKKFFVNVMLGGILVYISKNWQKLVDWWNETMEDLEPFFENMKKWIVDPLWKFVQWVDKEGGKLMGEVLKHPAIQKSLDAISDKLKEFTGLDLDLKNALNKLPDSFRGGSSAPPGAQPNGNMAGAGSLFDLVSTAEGGVNSVNRGRAGDTPGGAMSLFGKNLTDMTPDEIYAHQAAGRVSAVGKYQIIADTMPGFIAYLQKKGIDTSTVKFTENIQDLFRNYTIESKRAKIGQFISGKSVKTFKDYSELETAQLELAAEFASVGVPRDMKKGEYYGYPKQDIKAGQSLYTGIGDNRASITPQRTAAALMYARQQGSAAARPPAPAVQPQAGESRFSSDVMEFRKFRAQQFGAKEERFATSQPDFYQIRELGIYGRSDYAINPLADDTNYEIEEHVGAGHHENRAFDIPVPISSRQGDLVAEFWRNKGYTVIWNNGDGVHHNHVHVEVPASKAAEFFRIIKPTEIKPTKPPGAQAALPQEPEQRVAITVPIPVQAPAPAAPAPASTIASAGFSDRALVNTSSRSQFTTAMWQA